MVRIDLHGHIAPPPYWAALERAGMPTPVPPWSVEQLLAVMDQYGITATVVSLPPPGVFFGDGAQARALARVVNEFAAELVQRYPARFAALATLPLPDIEAALVELDYALDHLQLDGVTLLTNTGTMYLGDPRLEPLFAVLDSRGCYVFVHPTMPVYPGPLPGVPPWVLEFPFETTRAIVSLLFSGIFERYGAIRWQFAHLGGTVPFLAYRIASVRQREPSLAGHLRRDPVETLRSLFYDTALSNYTAVLEATFRLLPAERIVFGTDWPYAALPDGPDPAPELDRWPHARPAIEGENARVLVPRLFERLGR
ncbi:amidohydrolase family protein [Thermomicrobium sp. 4228-Ro]|uniref:amidohydrolase family protein n=1 Tax=Thermomicrobium sp. 4228-Ro TaxID=2993937 RepID=UPI002248D7FF|nr:amidohydrolase family protein [Thermomicrobium sp. 4228-Ro]MCX2728299.1 amidohydrolase family protein [Thermomicrobium sp. 4228-Ro]